MKCWIIFKYNSISKISMFNNLFSMNYTHIMLVMELGLRFQEMKYEMMEIYQMEMDESRSVLV